MPIDPMVSVIIPCLNEEGYIADCLDSILSSDYPLSRMEILVADGRSTDGTREIVSGYAARYAFVRLLDNSVGTTPAGLNLAIRATSGDVIIRMDAHVIYPSGYIRRLVRGLEESGADNVGGVLETVAAEDSAVARAIAVGMSHRFGVGNSHFRVGTAAAREVDTVPFGCFRRDVFTRAGFFDEELVRNQDDEFNFRLISRGGRVLLLPDVSCRYFARRSLSQVARMYYQYGYFKPLVARKVGRVMTVRQLIPALLIAVLFGAAGLSFWSSKGGLVFLLVLSLYLSLVVVAALASLRTNGVRCSLALAAVFPVLHFSYGAGFLVGVWDHVLLRGSNRAGPVALSR